MSEEKPQMNLFDMPEWWEGEWEGMPEFVQEGQQPYSVIIIRFETSQDLQSFSKLIGQQLTKNTKSIWFPFKSHWGNNLQQRWVDES